MRGNATISTARILSGLEACGPKQQERSGTGALQMQPNP